MEKILVANRGEIALRVIRTLKKMGIGTVAVYSEPDEPLPFVREADHAYCIGKGPVRESYMNQDRLLEIAKKKRGRRDPSRLRVFVRRRRLRPPGHGSGHGVYRSETGYDRLDGR